MSYRIRTGFQLDLKVPLEQLLVVAAKAEKVVSTRRHAGKLCLAAGICPRARNRGGISGGDSLLASRLAVSASYEVTPDRGDSRRRLNTWRKETRSKTWQLAQLRGG